MKDDKDPEGVPALLREERIDPETGIVYVSTHGPTCSRTRAAYEAHQRGEDVTEAMRHNATACTGGPPQVATKAYRDGWESIFGAKVPVGKA